MHRISLNISHIGSCRALALLETIIFRLDIIIKHRTCSYVLVLACLDIQLAGTVFEGLNAGEDEYPRLDWR